MKPAPFEYAAPHTIGDAVALLAQSDMDETKILAGGQSLMPLINMRLARPKLLIDLSRVEELEFIREVDGGLAIGAMTTQARGRALAARPDADSRCCTRRPAAIAHPQIRNRGTIGGSMAQADPAAEYPAVALALDIEMVATGPGGERVIPAEDFFITYLTTDLAPDEILTEVRVPELAPGAGWGFEEVARRHGDFAMVGAVAVLRLEAGVAADTRIVLFGVADRAIRMTDAEACVNGQAPGAAVFERAAGQGRRGGSKSPCPTSTPRRGVPPSSRAGADAARARARPQGGARAMRGPGSAARRSGAARKVAHRRASETNGRFDPMTTAHQIRVTVNGVVHDAVVEPRTTLVDFLRGELSLTGTHVGCEHGVCGVCNVLLDGRAVRSCLMLAVQADGREITTVEGLVIAGELHPIQQAFQEEHGLQCGFCTPGFLMAIHEMLTHNPNPTEAEIKDVLGGQICRCTGYTGILRAVHNAMAKLGSAGA